MVYDEEKQLLLTAEVVSPRWCTLRRRQLSVLWTKYTFEIGMLDIYCNCVSEEKDIYSMFQKQPSPEWPHILFQCLPKQLSLDHVQSAVMKVVEHQKTVLLLSLIQLSPVKYLANIKHCEDHTRSTSTHKVLQHRSSEWLFGPRTSHWWCMFLVYCATLYSPSYVCLLSYMYLSFPFCEIRRPQYKCTVELCVHLLKCITYSPHSAVHFSKTA